MKPPDCIVVNSNGPRTIGSVNIVTNKQGYTARICFVAEATREEFLDPENLRRHQDLADGQYLKSLTEPRWPYFYRISVD